MAFNGERFVVIDGVQMSKERAKRLGLLKEKKATRSPSDEPPANRARTSDSARKGAGGSTKATDAGSAE